MFEVTEAIGRISVAAQKNGWPALANFCKHIKVPAGLHFDFDSLISGGEFGFDFFQQLLMRILNANGNSAIDFAQGPTHQLPQRLLLLAGFSIPESVLQGGFGHIVPADAGHDRGAVSGFGQLDADKGGGQELTNCVPSSFDPLVAEERSVAGHALRPSFDAIAMCCDQQHAAAL